MLASGVVIVQVIEQIDLAVELVEEATSKAEALVQKLDGRNERRLQNIFQPDQSGVSDGHAKQQDQMLQFLVCFELFVQAVEQRLVGLWVVDLMASPLRACVNTSEGNAGAELAIDVATAFLHIGSWLVSNDVRWVANVVGHDESILDLSGVRRCRALGADLCSRGRIRRESALRWGEVVLEKQVVLVRHTTNASEHGTLHEVISVRAKTVDDVVVVPDVDLRDLAVRVGEGTLSVPPHVVVEVIFVAVAAHRLRKRVLATLVWVTDSRPRLQRSVYTHSVIVDLIASTKHNVERLLFVHAEHVIPKRGARPSIYICAYTEAVARVEHDAHRLRSGGDDKNLRLLELLLVDIDEVPDVVRPSRLELLHGSLDEEAPESPLWILIQLLAAERPCLYGEANIARACINGACW